MTDGLSFEISETAATYEAQLRYVEMLYRAGRHWDCRAFMRRELRLSEDTGAMMWERLVEEARL